MRLTPDHPPPRQRRSLFAHIACAILTLAIVGSLPAAHAADSAGVEFFETKIRPVLVAHCYMCHAAESEKVKGGLRVDSRAALLKGGDTGPAIVLGKPAESLLIHAVRHEDDLIMPPKKRLSDAIVNDLQTWVKQGAPWPEEAAPKATAAGATEKPAIDFDKFRREHWAYQPLKAAAVPRAKDAAWAKSPIDAFILAKLEEKGLRPAPPAERRTLLRRVYLDLIGLPPTPDEARAFLADTSADALAKVVDDLLARPQYGERWGRHWLDVARYAETEGYERDEPKKFAWRYRDYVIDALNADKPYDRFLTEQLAGDELPEPTAQTQTATSFLALGTFDTIAADSRLARYDQRDDIVGTTTAVFLAQTVRCARCHDHKFEPFAQTDYYRLLSVFEPFQDKAGPAPIGSEAEREAYRKLVAPFDAEAAPLLAEFEALALSRFDRAIEGNAPLGKDGKKKKPALPGDDILKALRKPAGERNAKDLERLARERKSIYDQARQASADEEKPGLEKLYKGLAELDAKRPPVPQAFVFGEKGAKAPLARLFIRGDPGKPGPEVQPGVPMVLTDGTPLVAPTPTAISSGRRTSLANWLTGPGRDQVARVMANRVWQWHFGRGIVATSNDFGVRGEPPTHPELLDWLASELQSGGWKLKRLHRAIILSSIYQTSASHDAEPDADPENKLLRHWPTRRLESEAIRDSILAVSGKLNPEMGGPPIYPPFENKLAGDSAQSDWGQSDERQSARRSVYVFRKRTIPLPDLDILGLPDTNGSIERRDVYSTALQSLLLMNGRFAIEQSAFLAERVKAEAGNDPRAQVTRAFEVVLCRPPRANEVEAALAYLAATPEVATVPALKEKSKVAPASPLASFCLVLLNTNEFAYLN